MLGEVAFGEREKLITHDYSSSKRFRHRVKLIFLLSYWRALRVASKRGTTVNVLRWVHETR